MFWSATTSKPRREAKQQRHHLRRQEQRASKNVTKQLQLGVPTTKPGRQEQTLANQARKKVI
jgi:hypothetical protein